MALKSTGLSLQLKQGDSRIERMFVKGAVAENYDDLKNMVEAANEFSVVGYSLVMQEEQYVDGTMVINEGTATKCKIETLTLEREDGAGNATLPLYLTLPVPQDDTKKASMKTAIVGKTVAGYKVTGVKSKSYTTY